MKESTVLLLVFVTIGLFIAYSEITPKPTDVYKYKVHYDDGYKTTYSHSKDVKGTCIETMNGKICGTFYIENNRRYSKGE